MANSGKLLGRVTGGISAVVGSAESSIGLANAVYNKDYPTMIVRGGEVVSKGAGCVIGSVAGPAGCVAGVNAVTTIGDAGNFIVGKAVDKVIDTLNENETAQWSKVTEQDKQAYQAGLERRRKREAEQAFGQRMNQGYTERMNQNEPINVPSDIATGDSDSDSSSDTTSTILSGIMQGVGTVAQVALPIMQNQALAEQQQQQQMQQLQIQQQQQQQQQQLQRQQAYSNAQAIPLAPQITRGLPPGTPPNDGMHDADWVLFRASF